MAPQDWNPVTGVGFDVDAPSAARLYDYFLGGAVNFAVDRELAKQIIAVHPEIPMIARVNREFLRRAVKYLAERGIRQFVDIGCGLPTVHPVHETARKINPDARVVYVDNDPIALAHGELLVESIDHTSIVYGDLRDPLALWAAVAASGLLDLDEPVGVLIVAVLHFLSDDDAPAEIVRALADIAPRGSYIALSHGTIENRPDLADVVEKYRERVAGGAVARDHAQIAGLFAGLELVEPGLVHVTDWHPETDRPALPDAHAAGQMVYGGIGRVATDPGPHAQAVRRAAAMIGALARSTGQNPAVLTLAGERLPWSS